MKRFIRWTGIAILLCTIIYVALSWVAADRLTSARNREVGDPPASFPFAIESVTLKTRDGQSLAGWYVPALTPDKAVVLLHGYRGTRKHMVPRAQFLRELGYNVLLYDARAFGESTGDVVTFGYREKDDVLAAVEFLRSHGHNRIACLGVSQGGATILFAADELRDVKCVACESVYDEMTHAVDRRMRRYMYMPGWLGAALMVPMAEHRLDLSISDVRPVDHISKLGCPVFVISGDCDDRTWPADTERLFAAAREPKELWMVNGATHQDLFHWDGYQDKLRAFLQKHMD
jgi:fermentation-respiration switch protein FrsA (DUF1100 family)